MRRSQLLPCTLAALVLSAALTRPALAVDLREAYDVIEYRLDIAVAPEEKAVDGIVAVEARVVADTLDTFVLDVADELEVTAVETLPRGFDIGSPLTGTPLRFEHEDDTLVCRLGRERTRGDLVRVAVTYTGEPRSRDRFTGFHWETSADGSPWIGTSFQMIGAHHWFPCKASYFHPEDKPTRLSVNLDVPLGLTGVSNGRLVGRRVLGEREIFSWEHGYPLSTYAITVNVAPYVTLKEQLFLPGMIDPVDFVAYVLPENEEKARVQFRDVLPMLKIFSEAFGPYPFPSSKFGLVETSFWGMEHSTAVAYGSSYPAWCKANDKPDRFAARNEFFDYILIHESAHEWWGNAVSSKAWGDFWIQEGFATYAEGVYVERLQDRATADRFFAKQARSIGKRSRLYRGKDLEHAQKAYSPTIYTKGACVLNTLRHYVDDDEAWWKTIRTFYENHRYENASTRDFLRVLNRVTGDDWRRFFDEWIYGEGYPRVTGTVTVDGSTVHVRVENEGSGGTGFRVPLDLQWIEGVRQVRERLWLEPGTTELDLERETVVEDLELRHLDRVLGRHDVRVR